MKCVAITALLLAIIFWNYAPAYALPLRFIVGLGALLVAIQAVRAKKHFWAVGFYIIAGVFNPFAALVTLEGSLSGVAVFAAVVFFALSLRVLKTQALLSMPSITDGAPRRESL